MKYISYLISVVVLTAFVTGAQAGNYVCFESNVGNIQVSCDQFCTKENNGTQVHGVITPKSKRCLATELDVPGTLCTCP